jgi:hypothetical protein
LDDLNKMTQQTSSQKTSVATQVFDLEEFRAAAPGIFHCLDVIKNVAIERRTSGVKRFDEPLSFFDHWVVNQYFDAAKNKFGVDLKVYYGPDGLSDSASFKPAFFIRMTGDEYQYSFKRRFFEEPSPVVKTTDADKVLEMLVGWAQSYAQEFHGIYLARGGNPDLDHEEFLAQAVKLAMMKRRLLKEQSAVTRVVTADGEAYTPIVLEPFPLSVEEIQEQAKQADFTRVADLRMWGRAIEHMISKAAKLIKSSIITKEVEAETNLQSQIDSVRRQISLYGIAVKKAEGGGLFGLFKKKAAPEVKLNANEFLQETLARFEALEDSIFVDQDRCLRMVGNVESFIRPFDEYGDILGYHEGILRDMYKRRAAEKTALDGVADDNSNQILANMKERREQLHVTQKVYKGVSLGLQNYLVCKNSQYEALEHLKATIGAEVYALIQMAMVKTAASKPAEQIVVVMDTVAKASAVLDELQKVVETGNEYDNALLSDAMDTIKPIANQQNDGIKLLPAPMPG